MRLRNIHTVPIPGWARPELKLPDQEKKPKSLPKWLVGLLIFCLVVGVGWLVGRDKSQESVYVAQENVLGALRQAQDQEMQSEEVVAYTISEGDIPAEIFLEYGTWDANDVEALLASGGEVYDFTNLKIGREIRFYFNGEERAMRLEYDKNTETMVVAERSDDEFTVREQDIAYDVTEAQAHATINRFLYIDALDAGLTEPTVLDMGDIFSFDIDFTTEIRAGDSFSVIYEKRTRDGEEAPDGYILAAKFVNVGEEYFAYHFESDGYHGYYDSEGRELERQFLRAPLSYRRITSGFTGARLHPITRKVTAHYQIDYAAPTGTPVVATAHGTVTQAGYSGGWGNIVRLTHDNGFTTHYAHLSSFAKGVRSGTRVSRGEVVGYVGSTGWSTGPHLDYGMKLDGAPVNPLALKLPKGEPLEGERMVEFEKMKEKYNGML